MAAACCAKHAAPADCREPQELQRTKILRGRWMSTKKDMQSSWSRSALLRICSKVEAVCKQKQLWHVALQ